MPYYDSEIEDDDWVESDMEDPFAEERNFNQETEHWDPEDDLLMEMYYEDGWDDATWD